MAEFVADCPRCGALRATHDVFASVVVAFKFRWQQLVEVSCICRSCHRMSTHLVSRQSANEELHKFFGGLHSKNATSSYKGSLNDIVSFERHISLRDREVEAPPEHLSSEIETIILEANSCLSAECWNASAAMYRLALDVATKVLLHNGDEPNARTRRSLGLRLTWLFQNGGLPKELEPLANCVQQDGNDGAHDGTLTKVDAEDLHDFAYELLRRLYTEPARLRIAKERREARRQA